MSSSPVQGIFLLLAGGSAAIVWGMKRFQLKREMENTPTSKIRSAAMGRVEFSGIARSCKPLRSPVTQRDCCWWLCEVQELRKSGKHSKWVTIHRTGSIDFFFLDDPTGRVLVSPEGAMLRVANVKLDLNHKTRTQLTPLLHTWGINAESLFGFNRSLRVVESCLPDHAPVYVLGELSLTRTHLTEREVGFRERLRAIKADPSHMAKADANKDGSVDADEWDAYRIQQEEAFLREELARDKRAGPAETMIVKAPAEGHFVISTGGESDLHGLFGWLVPLSLFGGLVLTGGGLLWAVHEQWSPVVIVLCVIFGLVFGWLMKSKGATTWE